MDFQDRIKSEEGYRAVPYLDNAKAKNPTVGWGLNLNDPVARNIMKSVGGNPDKAFEMRYKIAVQDAGQLIPGLGKLPNAVREVATDMSYNMGLPTYQKFQKHLAAMRVGDWRTAAKELMNSDYATQVPNRAQRNYQLLMNQAQIDAANRQV